MIHSSEEVWALDDGHHGRVGDHTARGSDPHTALGDAHVPHAAGAILGCEPTELCLPPQICCGSCYETEKQLCFALLLLGAAPGFASNLFQPLIGMAESTPLFRPQL